MKKILSSVIAFLFIIMGFTPMLSIHIISGKSGYPYDTTGTDPWGFVKLQCTSYAAWAINDDGEPFSNGMMGPNGETGWFGNATNWDNNASDIGFDVSNTPTVGSIAVWDAFNGGTGSAGHVAYVEEINSDGSVNISEYNWNYGDKSYNERFNKIADHYIKFLESEPEPEPESTFVGIDNITSINFTPSGSSERYYQAVRDANKKVNTRYTTDGTNWSSWYEYGGSSTNIAMEVFDGKLYQAVAGKNSDIVHIRYTADGDTWTEWSEMEIKTDEDISLISHDSQLFIAAVGRTSNEVYTAYTTNGVNWSDWQSNGKAITPVTSVVYDDDMYQFIAGTSKRIFVRKYISADQGEITWGDWSLIDGKTESKIHTTIFNGDLYISVRGNNDKINVRNTLGGDITNPANWSAWFHDGGKATDEVEMVTFGGKIYQGVRGTSSQGAFFRNLDSGTWSTWTSYGGTSTDVNLHLFQSTLYTAVKGKTSTNTVFTGEVLTSGGVNWDSGASL